VNSSLARCSLPRAGAWALSLALGLGAPAALAQTPDGGVSWEDADGTANFKATQYYKAGTASFNRNDFAAALEAFQNSYGVVRSPNSRLMIVRSLFELGRYEEAYREAQELAEEAESAAAKAEKYKPAVEAASVELKAAKAKLAFVVIQPSAEAAGAEVSLNGEPVPAEQWGQEILVDPGPIEVVMTTEGGTVTEKGEAKIGEVVELKPTQKGAPEEAPAPVQMRVDTGDGGYSGPDRTSMAIIAGSVGVLGMTNFGIFGLLANGQFSRLEDLCEGRTCDPELETEADSGNTYQLVANVSLGIGVAGLAAGAGLFIWELLDPAESSEEAAERPQLHVGPGSVMLTGTF